MGHDGACSPRHLTNNHAQPFRMLQSFDGRRVSASAGARGDRVYKAILRATTFLAVILTSVTSARANARVFVDVPAATATVPASFVFYSKGSNLAVRSARVFDTRDANGITPSDHRPVLTTFLVK